MRNNPLQPGALWICAVITLTALGAACAVEPESSKAVSYTSFQEKELKLHPWPGKRVVFLTKSGDLDAEVMQGLCEVFDRIWEFYRDATGREPRPRKTLDGRLTIAEVEGIGGAAWGYLGEAGIELTPDVMKALVEKFARDGEIDQALPYEFGRNFWYYSKQLGYHKPDNSRAITTGYAVFMRMMALDAVGKKVGSFRGRTGEEFRKIMESLVDLHESHHTLTWRNTILLDKAPKNELGLNGTDLFASFCMRLARDHGGLDFVKELWKETGKRPNAKTTQDAVDNFVLAASAAAGKNLTQLFTIQWRWPVSEKALAEAKQYPAP